jgi:hypothetical protein
MRIRSATLLCYFFLVAVPILAWAGRERIEKIAVEIIKEEIIVSFELGNGFNRATERDIQDGIEKDFYYYVVLNQKEDHWFYEEVAEKTIRYTVKYDTLRKDYTVRRREGLEIVERVFDSAEEMRAFISRGEKIHLAPISLLKQGRRYHVWVKAQMKASHIPRDLERLLFFIPFLELDTPWAKSSSLYALP